MTSLKLNQFQSVAVNTSINLPKQIAYKKLARWYSYVKSAKFKSFNFVAKTL